VSVLRRAAILVKRLLKPPICLVRLRALVRHLWRGRLTRGQSSKASTEQTGQPPCPRRNRRRPTRRSTPVRGSGRREKRETGHIDGSQRGIR
jgi:hypothetical protein